MDAPDPPQKKQRTDDQWSTRLPSDSKSELYSHMPVEPLQGSHAKVDVTEIGPLFGALIAW